MVAIKTYSHDWAEVEVCLNGKLHRCELYLKHDLLVDKEGHKAEIEAIKEMDWSKLKKEYRGCH